MYIAQNLLGKGSHLSIWVGILAIAALLVVAIGVGCGGGDDSSSNATTASKATSAANPTSSSAPLSKAKFVARANAICQRRIREGLKAVTEEVEKKAKPGNNQSSKQVQAETVHTLFLPEIEAMMNELAELGTPPKDGEEVEAILVAMRSGFDKSMETEYTSASIASFGQEFRQSVKLARRYGIPSCAIG